MAACFQEEFMTSNQINLGIIGAGKITTDPNRHIDSIRSLHDDHVKIMAVADIIPGLARQTAERFGIPYYFEDYHDLLAMQEINAVTVNTNTATHKAIAIDCIESGKHLYVEKPICLNAEELKELLKTARQHNTVFLGGSNGLLQRQMLFFRKMIEQGMLGETYLVSVDRLSSGNHEYGTGAPKGKHYTGISSHSGSHNIEWALYLLGDPKPVSVQARGFFQQNPLTLSSRMDQFDDDSCAASVNFDNGSLFLFKALRAAPGKDSYVLNIYGDKMSVTYDVLKCYKQHSDDCIRFYENQPGGGTREIDPKLTCGHTHADMYAHFFRCIRNHEVPLSNGDRGLVTMRIIDAMEKSIQSGGKQILL